MPGFTLRIDTLGISAGGAPLDGSALANELLSSRPINSATYRCEGGSPVIEFQTASSTHPVRLTAG